LNIIKNQLNLKAKIVLTVAGKNLKHKTMLTKSELIILPGENPRNRPKLAGAFYERERQQLINPRTSAQRPQHLGPYVKRRQRYSFVSKLTNDPSRAGFITEEGMMLKPPAECETW